MKVSKMLNVAQKSVSFNVEKINFEDKKNKGYIAKADNKIIEKKRINEILLLNEESRI